MLFGLSGEGSFWYGQMEDGEGYWKHEINVSVFECVIRTEGARDGVAVRGAVGSNFFRDAKYAQDFPS
jgi:hypothetical protein